MDIEGSRDRAVLLGVLRMFLEGRRRLIGDRGFRVEIFGTSRTDTVKFPGYYLANGDDAPWMAHCDNGPAA